MWDFLLQFFFRVNVDFQPSVCNGCHDMLQKAMNINEIEIVSIKVYT